MTIVLQPKPGFTVLHIASALKLDLTCFISGDFMTMDGNLVDLQDRDMLEQVAFLIEIDSDDISFGQRINTDVTY